MILHADCTREDSRENDAAHGTIARETENDYERRARMREKKREIKKRDGKKQGRWTMKGRAWLERRDDGAGKEKKKGRQW